MNSINQQSGIEVDNAKNLLARVCKRNRVCTLATASISGEPEAAVMLFAEDDTSFDLFFYAFSDAKKCPNLKENPRASVVIYNFPDYVQMSGAMTALSGVAAAEARRRLIDKDDGAEHYHADSRCLYYRFIPQTVKIRIDPNFPSKYVEFRL